MINYFYVVIDPETNEAATFGEYELHKAKEAAKNFTLLTGQPVTILAVEAVGQYQPKRHVKWEDA